MIRIKRVYEKPTKTDGQRILIDRLWPRGLSKSQAKIDFWLKEIAPSTELRKWFSHDPAKWSEFKRRYFKELNQSQKNLAELKKLLKKKSTLVYSAKDTQFNNAVALKEYLEK